jgi:hypothetical protein
MKDDAIVFWIGVGVGVAFGIRLAQRLRKESSRRDQDQPRSPLTTLKRRVETQRPTWAPLRSGT